MVEGRNKGRTIPSIQYDLHILHRFLKLTDVVSSSLRNRFHSLVWLWTVIFFPLPISLLLHLYLSINNIKSWMASMNSWLWICAGVYTLHRQMWFKWQINEITVWKKQQQRIAKDEKKCKGKKPNTNRHTVMMMKKTDGRQQLHVQFLLLVNDDFIPQLNCLNVFV